MDQPNVNALYELREYTPGDKPFIMASMLKGLYYGSQRYGSFDKRMFMDSYKLIIEAMLESPDVAVQVACSTEASDLIMGYSLLSADYQTIHWVFVKTLYRKIGIGRTLVPQFPTHYTHASDLAPQLTTKLQSKPTFNPFLIAGAV